MPVDAPLYPVGLVVAGRRCLVVGGGRIAARKVDGLVAAGAAVTVVAPDVLDEIAVQPEVTVRRRPYERGDVRGFQLVITATDDPAVNAAVFEDGEAAGVWVNSADDPANCSFILPAVLRRGPVVVTVSTSGQSPALASWLRDRIGDEVVGDDAGTLALELSAERDALHAAGQTTEGLDWVPRIEALQPECAADTGGIRQATAAHSQEVTRS
ncbi:MAG: precorrin-2 dehydrogenase/sirohydrochlorin ferrochelatase family protein [Acidimicrobiales bacterium]